MCDIYIVALADHGFVGVVETAWREEMREVRTAATSGTQVLGEATAVHDGLQSVVHAVRKGSVPLFQAAFEAIAAKLDGGQVGRRWRKSCSIFLTLTATTHHSSSFASKKGPTYRNLA